MKIDEPTKQAILTASQSWLALVDIGDFPEGLNRATENFRSRHSPELFEAKSLMWNSTKSSGGTFSRDFKSMRHTSSQFDWPQGDYIMVEYETRQTGLDKRPYLEVTPMVNEGGE